MIESRANYTGRTINWTISIVTTIFFPTLQKLTNILLSLNLLRLYFPFRKSAYSKWTVHFFVESVYIHIFQYENTISVFDMYMGKDK